MSQSNTAAKILYRPVGLTSSIVAGLVSSLIFKKVWSKAASDENSDPPKALESDYSLKEIVIAAALQGLIYSVVKALVDRGGARTFERFTGEWPGN